MKRLMSLLICMILMVGFLVCGGKTAQANYEFGPELVLSTGQNLKVWFGNPITGSMGFPGYEIKWRITNTDGTYVEGKYDKYYMYTTSPVIYFMAEFLDGNVLVSYKGHDNQNKLYEMVINPKTNTGADLDATQYDLTTHTTLLAAIKKYHDSSNLNSDMLNDIYTKITNLDIKTTNIDTKITNLDTKIESLSSPPVITKVSTTNGATATKSGSINIVATAINASQYRYRVNNGAFSGWQLSPVLNINSLSPGVNVIEVQATNSLEEGAPVSSGYITVFNLP